MSVYSIDTLIKKERLANTTGISILMAGYPVRDNRFCTAFRPCLLILLLCPSVSIFFAIPRHYCYLFVLLFIKSTPRKGSQPNIGGGCEIRFHMQPWSGEEEDSRQLLNFGLDLTFKFGNIYWNGANGWRMACSNQLLESRLGTAKLSLKCCEVILWYTICFKLFPHRFSTCSFPPSPPALPPPISPCPTSNNRKTTERQPLEVALSMPHSRGDPMSETG